MIAAYEQFCEAYECWTTPPARGLREGAHAPVARERVTSADGVRGRPGVGRPGARAAARGVDAQPLHAARTADAAAACRRVVARSGSPPTRRTSRAACRGLDRACGAHSRSLDRAARELGDRHLRRDRRRPAARSRSTCRRRRRHGAGRAARRRARASSSAALEAAGPCARTRRNGDVSRRAHVLDRASRRPSTATRSARPTAMFALLGRRSRLATARRGAVAS